MAEITAATVKALRDATGQGMMECKKALQEAGGDMDAARDLLRKKGLVTAEKKGGRETKEGLIGIAASDDGKSAAMVEVQCETDFCARNEVFQSMVQQVTELALAEGEGDVPPTDAIGQAVQETLAKIGENMSYARGVRIAAPRVGTYLHHNRKVGVVVGVEGEIDDETLSNLCMHIAFADPAAITREGVPSEWVEKEKEIAREQAIASGKPAEIAEKIVTGKVNKFLAANALVEQAYIRDDKKTVGDLLGGATVTAFARYAVGG